MERSYSTARFTRFVLSSMLGASVLCAPFCVAQVQVNPMLALKAFEPAAAEEYRLGRGDEINLDFGNRTELNGKRIVGPDGRITLPMAGTVMVADKSRDDAANAILNALAPYYTHLTVTVGVERYTSNRVLVLGAVQHPGVLTFDAPPTLLEVITRGGVLGGGADSLVKLPAVPERCAIYRGSDQVLWVDLKALLNSGNALADIRLRRDDVVYVPSLQDRTVSVLGHVNHPGSLQLDSTTTLAKLIADAGGLAEGAGNNPKIRIVSPKTGVTRVIAFNMLLKPKELDLTLNPGDVIYVPQAGFDKFTYVVTKLTPLVTAFQAAAYVVQ